MAPREGSAQERRETHPREPHLRFQTTAMEVPGNFWRKKKANGQSKGLGMRGTGLLKQQQSEDNEQRTQNSEPKYQSKAKAFAPMLGVELIFKKRLGRLLRQTLADWQGPRELPRRHPLSESC